MVNKLQDDVKVCTSLKAVPAEALLSHYIECKFQAIGLTDSSDPNWCRKIGARDPMAAGDRDAIVYEYQI